MTPMVLMLTLLKIDSFETFENKNNQKLLSKLIMHSNIDKTINTVLKLTYIWLSTNRVLESAAEMMKGLI